MKIKCLNLAAKLIAKLLSREVINNQQNNSVTVINVHIDINNNDKH